MVFMEEQIRLATDKYFHELKSQEAICGEFSRPGRAILPRLIRRDACYGILRARFERKAPLKASRLKYLYDEMRQPVLLPGAYGWRS